MREIRWAAAAVYLFLLAAAVRPVSAGGAPLGWALAGLVVPVLAVVLAQRDPDRPRPFLMAAGLVVGAFLLLNAHVAVDG